MDKQQMKIIGIVLLVICAICIFVAIERYHTNASNVRAMNQFQQSTPLGNMMPQGAMKPATPAATKYAILFAIVSGIAGVILLVKAGAPDQSQSAEPPVV